jgi:hypothetical protein
MSSIIEGKVSLPLPATASCVTAITTCTKQSGILKQCAAYSTTPVVQTAVTAMDAAVAVLQGTETQLNQARALVSTLEAKRASQMVTVRLTHDTVESTLNTVCNNDPVAAKAWTGDTKQRATPLAVGAVTLPPENAAVRVVKAHPGMVEASCAKEQSVVGYAFQIGTDPAHPELWPAQIMTQGHTHKFPNLPIGQLAYVRIAVIRRGSIQSPWSPILQIAVR